jgi:hypothetical protein
MSSLEEPHILSSAVAFFTMSGKIRGGKAQKLSHIEALLLKCIK